MIRNITFVLFSLFFLSGCNFGRLLDIQLTSTPDSFPIPTLPSKVVMAPVKWTVLNKEELENLLTTIEKTNNQRFSIIALDSDNFKNLVKNIEDLRRYILQQQEVIRTYVLYFEERKNPEKTKK